jgi:hypothetical protein
MRRLPRRDDFQPFASSITWRIRDADLQVLTSDQKPIDQDNIVLTEVVRPGRGMEYTVTVLMDGTAIAVTGPFLTLDEAVDQANEQARHYAVDPIYFRREQA